MFFSDNYYVCEDESIEDVSKKITGDVRHANRIVQYNKEHNPKFRLYTKEKHCRGNIMVPKDIYRGCDALIKTYSGRKVISKDLVSHPKKKNNHKKYKTHKRKKRKIR